MSAVLRRARLSLALLALGLVCALLVGRLPSDLERTVVTRRHHGSDPLLSAALLRFDVEALLHHPTRYFSPPFLYPDPNPLRGTEPLVSEALLAVPFRLALGDRPATVFTCVKLATLALVALFTGLLLRELSLRPALCLLGGGLAVLIGTMPVFADRLQAISIQWLALAGLFASRVVRRGRPTDAVLFALSAFLSVQASLYTSVMLLAPLPFVTPALWGQRDEAWRRGRGLVAGVAAVAALSLGVLWPFLHGRADVAAYSSATYSTVKTWHPAALGDFAVSPPEYAGWPLGPTADWLGLFPGTAFMLLLAGCAALALLSVTRLDHTGVERALPGSFRFSKPLLTALLASLAATVCWSVRLGASGPPGVLADILLWATLVAWSVRLALWPKLEGETGAPVAGAGVPLGLLASAAALAAFVLLLVSLGTPIRTQAGGDPLLHGLFAPLSRALPPIRELRELNRCLLPAGWLAVVAATLSLERRLRQQPARRAATLAAGFSALVLGVGLCERLTADTRKGTAPAVPEAYELLRQSSGTGGLLELPVDAWGRIDSVYRMLWQPAHGRPIVAGRTGIEPGWYQPAQQVFDEFPSEESLRLARAWHVDTVLDTRPEAARQWPASVVLRAERAAQAGRRGEATWRLFDLTAGPGPSGLEAEPPPGPGEWARPSTDGDAAAARDGQTDTAVEVDRPEGLELLVPGGVEVGAIELDYGRGLFNRVPRTLHVLGLEAGTWRDLAGEPEVAWLRARAAHQLLHDQYARLVIPLQPSRASRLRLASPDVPWDLPEVRLRLVANR